MYKKQMICQKILCFAAVAVCAVTFLYALGLMTDLHDGLYFLMPNPDDASYDKIEGARIFYDMQPFNKQLLSNSILFLLAACLLFVTNTHNRRKYYVGNAISTAVYVVGGLVFCGWIHSNIIRFKEQFLTTIDFAKYKDYIASSTTAAKYIDSTFWFDVHYGVIALVALVCLLMIGNFIWKQMLMRAEKKLIQNSKEGAAMV